MSPPCSSESGACATCIAKLGRRGDDGREQCAPGGRGRRGPRPDVSGCPDDQVGKGEVPLCFVDLRQLVWILTVTADGAVPIAHRVELGNTEDSTAHIATWDGLCDLLGGRTSTWRTASSPPGRTWRTWSTSTRMV